MNIFKKIWERESKSQGNWYFPKFKMKFAKEKVNPKENDLNLKEENPWKTQGGWHFLMMKIQNWELFGFTREMGSETKHKSCQNHEEIESFSQIKRKEWRKWFKSTR